MPDFLFTLILLGSIQGVIVCGLLLFSKGRLLPNRLLTFIIATITLPGFHLYFHYKGVYDINGFTRFIHDIMPMVIFMPVGPLIYFYVRSLINPGSRINKKAWVHFLPVIIDLIPKIAGLVLHISFWLGYPISSRAEYRALDDLYNQYADIPRWISVTVYLILAIRYFKAHSDKIHPASQKINAWLKLFTGLFAGFQMIWLLYLIPYILPALSDQLLKAVNWFPIYIPMTILVYWLGIQGYLTSLKLTIPKKQNQGDWVPNAWLRLSNSMEKDQLYLDPELSVGKVAEHTGLSTRQISELLNQYRFTNFNAFINHYRVEEFKSRLAGPTANQFTMAGLAMKCGFNSPATFNRIFKQYTGMVPSAFLKANGKTLDTAGNHLKSA
jgi:AraC-like DNA-binding protein